MKRIKHYLEDVITTLIFDTVISFWEQPIIKPAFKSEIKSVLDSVEKKLFEKIETDDRFVDAE